MKNISLQINWKKNRSLIPAVIQDSRDGRVLMLGYMNRGSFKKTLQTRKVWFYSRTRKRLWMKGETSGNTLSLVDMKLDCDGDTLLVKVKPKGPVCHTGAETCFQEEKSKPEIFEELFDVIADRKKKMPEGSYTTFLFSKGLPLICEKVREESEEVIQAATRETRKRIGEESVDLLYHLFVLLAEKGIRLEDVRNEMRKRRKS